MIRRCLRRHLLIVAMLLPAAVAGAIEPAQSQRPAVRRVLEVPAGPWQGEWIVVRDDPRIRTRAGAEVLRLSIVHDAGSDRAQVQWIAGRAVCDDMLAEPCEWVGARGQIDRAVAAPTGLYLRLPLSPDESAPFLLHLSRPAEGAPGVLFDDDVRYRVELVMEPAPSRR